VLTLSFERRAAAVHRHRFGDQVEILDLPRSGPNRWPPREILGRYQSGG
jgi:hypothetical protein